MQNMTKSHFKSHRTINFESLRLCKMVERKWHLLYHPTHILTASSSNCLALVLLRRYKTDLTYIVTLPPLWSVLQTLLEENLVRLSGTDSFGWVYDNTIISILIGAAQILIKSILWRVLLTLTCTKPGSTIFLTSAGLVIFFIGPRFDCTFPVKIAAK